MKKLTREEIAAILAEPNGPVKLVQMNIDLDSLFDNAAAMFKEEGAASALLIRLAAKKQYLIRISEDETIKEAAGKISPLGYGCAGFIKSSLDDVGGFEDVNLSPEVLMACALMEKGDRVAYCKDAVVIRSNNYSLIKQFKRYYDIGSFQKKKLSGHGYSPDIKNELRLNVKSAMYLLDYKEYLWLGYDRLYKGAKYLGWLLGSLKIIK